jgi:hypothetical protein
MRIKNENDELKKRINNLERMELVGLGHVAFFL